MQFEPRDFLNIFLRFWLFEPHFHIKLFLIKKKPCNSSDLRYKSSLYIKRAGKHYGVTKGNNNVDDARDSEDNSD